MAITTKIEPVEDFIQAAISETLSPEARSKAVAKFARERLTDAQRQNLLVLGRVPPHETYVDGSRGAPLERVNPDRGNIVFEFELIGDVLRAIAAMLYERSPVVSGAYRNGHTVFADGAEIALGDRIPHADEYSFTNYVPYSRRLEIGKTKSGRDFLVSVPNRIYERTAKDARQRFGNVATIRFTYRGIVGGAQINPLVAGATSIARNARNGRFSQRGGSRAHNVSANRWPTITVQPPGR